MGKFLEDAIRLFDGGKKVSWEIPGIDRLDQDRKTGVSDLLQNLASGSVPKARAIAGSEVAITVESMFSMNNATATMSGTTRSYELDGVLKD